ncbi:MAG: rod shape-determining protein [Thermoguttaceae bacterium]|jgi:rod shape-determining protein MreB
MLSQLFGQLRIDLAVDLGTANTRIGAPGEGLVLDEPSIAAVDPESRQILAGGRAVGHLAQQMLGRAPDSISVVEPIRSGVVADYEVCEAMLRHFFGKARRGRAWGKPRVLVPISGDTTPVERRAVLSSTHRAGAGQVLLIAKLKAAALGAGLPVAEPVASMVCDIGAGSTEVGVISLADLVAHRSIRIAGREMDQAVADYVRRHFSLRISHRSAERLRLEIGSARDLPSELVSEVRGVDQVSGLPREALVASEQVREALEEPLDRIVDAIGSTLDRLDPELAADLMGQGLVLCGGGAQLSGIDRMIAERTGLPVRLAPEPALTVARGALVCLEHLDQWGSLLEGGARG